MLANPRNGTDCSSVTRATSPEKPCHDDSNIAAIHRINSAATCQHHASLRPRNFGVSVDVA
jgi:hypothetical protein